jgi:P-loop Domain of unknown function (DUF2791)
MSKATKAIRPRERDTIIQALSAGVVPRVGLAHIQVGRAGEIAAMLRDIDRIADAGAAVRFVIGEYGAGKTFFASIVRLIALERKCVTMHADLSPNRRIHASGGQARALYSEAVNNMATRNKPEGGALQSIVERLVTDAAKAATEKDAPVEGVIEEMLAPITQFAGGYDFATVLKAYWRGSEESNDPLKQCAVRWLRGEYTTKTDAKKDLGVRTIIDDENVYDSLKSLACLVRIAGYSGLLVMFDEMANIYKLQNSQARKQNYEQLLDIVNDSLQGTTSGIGFVMCGTPEFLLDTRRGLFSYEALRSRLAENTFANEGLVDLSGPVLRLQSLSPEDLLILLGNIRMVFASGDPSKFLVPDNALTAFMEHCDRKIGEAYFRTPRSTIKAFVHMLSVLEQNSDARWQELLERIPIAPDTPDQAGDPDESGEGDELTSLRLNS